jgi:hypothetical protein
MDIGPNGLWQRRASETGANKPTRHRPKARGIADARTPTYHRAKAGRAAGEKSSYPTIKKKNQQVKYKMPTHKVDTVPGVLVGKMDNLTCPVYHGCTSSSNEIVDLTMNQFAQFQFRPQNHDELQRQFFVAGGFNDPHHPLFLTAQQGINVLALRTAEENEHPRPLSMEEIYAAMTPGVSFPPELRLRLRERPILMALGGSTFLYQNYHTLSPGKYVDDSIVEYFIRKRLRMYEEQGYVHLFDNCQYGQWENENHDSGMNVLRQGCAMDRNLRNDRAFLHRRGWLFPIVSEQHWQLLLIVQPYSNKRRIIVFDSIVGSRERPFNIVLLERFVRQVVNTAVRYNTPAGTVPPYVTQDQWIKYVDNPCQPNGFDCGIFTINYAIHACLHLEEVASFAGDHLNVMHWFTSVDAVRDRNVFCNEFREHVLRAAPLTCRGQRG